MRWFRAARDSGAKQSKRRRAIQANTTYVASYHTNAGHYSDDIGFFTAGSITTGPLHALGDGLDGPNGVYHYGAGSAPPTDTYHASNYWVDVIFSTL